MRVCFDVNVIIHLLAKTEQLGDAVFAYDVANARAYDVCVPASALADIAYILHCRGLSDAKVRHALDNLFELFDVIDVNGADGQRANGNGMKDFEDAVIAEACARNGVDLIIAHNVKDFRRSPVPAMDPAEFVKAYAPAGYSYTEMGLGVE